MSGATETFVRIKVGEPMGTRREAATGASLKLLVLVPKNGVGASRDCIRHLCWKPRGIPPSKFETRRGFM